MAKNVQRRVDEITTGDTQQLLLKVDNNNGALFVNETNSVNWITFSGSATGNDVSITSAGGDANIPISINAQGTGNLNLRTGNSNRLVVYGSGEIQANHPFWASDGTSSDPSISFQNETSTGFWRPSAGVVASVITGTEPLRITNTPQVLVADGTAASPVLAFANDPDSGFYSPAGNSITLTLNGTDQVLFGTNSQIDSSNTSSYRLIGDTSDATTPTLVPNRSQTTTGIGSTGTGDIHLIGGGSQIAAFDGSSSAVNHLRFTAEATGSNPTIQAEGTDANIGIYVSVKGNAEFETVTDTFRVTGTGSLIVPAGTEAERPSTPELGMVRYNSTEDEYEGYTDLGWKPIGGQTGTKYQLENGDRYEIETRFQYIVFQELTMDGDADLVITGTGELVILF